MKRLYFQGMVLALVIIFAASGCNLPAAMPQLASEEPAASAAPVQEVVVVTATPQPVQCVATATTNVNANVRSGPDTLYSVVGYLSLGGAAEIVGRNDANTWWYIKFAGGPGGYAWIAQSVAVATCLPAVVVVIPAPPPPAVVQATEKPPKATEEPIFLFPGLIFELIPSPTPTIDWDAVIPDFPDFPDLPGW